MVLLTAFLCIGCEKSNQEEVESPEEELCSYIIDSNQEKVNKILEKNTGTGICIIWTKIIIYAGLI